MKANYRSLRDDGSDVARLLAAEKARSARYLAVVRVRVRVSVTGVMSQPQSLG